MARHTRYWVGGTGSMYGTAHYSATSGGAGGASQADFETDLIFDANSFTADGQTVTVDPRVYLGSVNCTGISFNVNFVKETSYEEAYLQTYPAGTGSGYGNVTLSEKINWGNSLDLKMYGEGRIDFGGCLLNKARNLLWLTRLGGTSGIFNLDSEATVSDVLVEGVTLNTNGHEINTAIGISVYYSYAPGLANLGSSVVNAGGTLVDAWIGVYGDATINAGTSTINGVCLLDIGNDDNGITFYNVNMVGQKLGDPFGLAEILGNNTFSGNLTFGDVNSIGFDDSSVQTLQGDMTVPGATASHQVSFGLDGQGPATIQKASGTVDLSYCTLYSSIATGGATFNSLFSNGCLDGGGNSGWIFDCRRVFYNEGVRLAYAPGCLGGSPVWNMTNKDFGDIEITPIHYPGCGYWWGGRVSGFALSSVGKVGYWKTD
jgi:hypothetical protein